MILNKLKTLLFKKVKIKGKEYYLSLISFILILILITLPLIGYILRKFFEKDFSHLGSFGDYVAGTTVPSLTFLSIVALIFTITQQNRQIDIQNKQLDLQNKEIEKSSEKNYQESLPEKIIAIEESLEIIKYHINKLKEEHLILTSKSSDKPIHKSPLMFFYVSENFIVTPNIDFLGPFEKSHKDIKKKLVKVNTKAYKTFLNFIKEGEENYSDNIKPIYKEFVEFHNYITDRYSDVLDRYKFPLGDLPLFEEDKNELIKLKTRLFHSENIYFQNVINIHSKLKLELEQQLDFFIDELK